LGDQYFGEANWEDVLADCLYCVSFILVVIVYSAFLEETSAWKLALTALIDNMLYLGLAFFLFVFNNHNYWILTL
jgi:hypothetical protein